MDASKVIHARLIEQTSAGKRVYPLYLPQAPTYPAISYFQVSCTPTLTMRGIAFQRIRMQTDCWAETYADAQTLAQEVRSQLSWWSGTAGGVTVEKILLDDEETPPDPDMQLFRVSSDWTLFISNN